MRDNIALPFARFRSSRSFGYIQPGCPSWSTRNGRRDSNPRHPAWGSAHTSQENEFDAQPRLSVDLGTSPSFQDVMFPAPEWGHSKATTSHLTCPFPPPGHQTRRPRHPHDATTLCAVGCMRSLGGVLRNFGTQPAGDEVPAFSIIVCVAVENPVHEAFPFWLQPRGDEIRRNDEDIWELIRMIPLEVHKGIEDRVAPQVQGFPSNIPFPAIFAPRTARGLHLE